VEPSKYLHACFARLGRDVLSQRSAHAPSAVAKLALPVVLVAALAALGSVLHGAAGAHAMGAAVSTSPAVTTLAGAQKAPVHVRITAVRRRLNDLEGRALHVSGALQPPLVHRSVALQTRAGGRWHTVARTRTGMRGRFALRFVPSGPTTEAVRVATPGATRRMGLLNVYREVFASWYGGGGSLACGGELTSSTLGVASKTLPCGTLVTLRYGGRSVRVPVVDRGPYVPGREFDLTEATKQALGFPDLGSVWSNR
jgi:peptidoglycan lytic transglycosylase